jgi:hypothetical protein
MIKVPISAGELLDKLSILSIKSVKVTDVIKLKDVNKERGILKETAKFDSLPIPVLNIYLHLIYVNTTLWDIEDKLREKEKLKEFDEEFILLARMVYTNNDLRFEYKSQINILLNSDIVEVKQYK